MKKKNSKFIISHPITITLFTFGILFFATFRYTQFKRGQWEKDIRNSLLEILISKKSNIEKALYSRIYYTKGVAAFVSLKPDISSGEFEQLSKDFFKNDTVISSMSLSKGCIINAIYPYKGHEAAIGLNLIAHPKRKEIVEKTIATRKTFVAGPVELVEGGTAFISYTPIFDKTKDKNGTFWGMTDIVILLNKLFQESRLTSTENGFQYALRGYDGKGEKGEIFFGNPKIFNQNPVKIDINLPYGNWVLAAIPILGWNGYFDQDEFLTIILIVSSLIISILIGLFAQALLKIRTNENEFKAIFDSMDSFVAEINENGEYLQVVSNNPKLAVLPAKDLVGKSIHDVFKKEKANFFQQAITQCIQTKTLVIIDYSIKIEDVKRWFAARISYKKGGTVIFNAYDITDKKRAEVELLDSKQQLVALNAMKDKFFSIIAHDLRNPIGNFKSINQLLVDEYEDLNENEKHKLLNSMLKSTDDVNVLLENILQWYYSQQESIQLNAFTYNINEITNEVINLQQTNAKQKGIELINTTDQVSTAFFDKEMTSTVIRNLISNAIKFSNSGDMIRVENKPVLFEGKEFQQISIIDTGIGMNDDTINGLFRFDTLKTTHGTRNEKGSGLGLILCKEFIEKQGGVLKVKSAVGKGSIFYFTLPVNV
jgi:PAS domain S-box-containing protein